MYKYLLLLAILLFTVACTPTSNEEVDQVEVTEVIEETDVVEDVNDEVVGGGPIEELEVEAKEGFSPYQNIAYNYSFLYPDYYYLSAKYQNPDASNMFFEEIVTLYHKDFDGVVQGTPTLTVSVFGNSEGKSLEEWSMDAVNYTNYDSAIGSETVSTQGGYEALKYSIEGLGTFNCFIISNGEFIYQFVAHYEQEGQTVENDLPELIDSVRFY